MLGRPPIVFGLIVLLGVGLPLAVRLHEGVVPGNDEWSYAKAAAAMHVGHGVALQGFNQMFLIGQLIAGQPFLAAAGGGVTGLAVFGGVAAVLWLGSVLALTRFMLGMSRALVLVLVLAVSPVFALLSATFMTDLPAAASASIALLLCVRAMERASVGRLVLALIATTVAFTFREQAIVVLITVLVAVVVKWPQLASRFRAVALGSISLCLVVCLLLEHLRHAVPNGDDPPFGFGSVKALALPDSLARGVFTVALLLAPLVVNVARGPGRPGLRRALVMVSGTSAVAVLLFFTGHDSSVLLGNFVERDGAYADAMVGSPPPVFGSVTWPILQLVAVAAAIGLCCEISTRVQTWRGSRPAVRDVPVRTLMLYAHCAILAGVYLVLAFLGQHQYDRYVLPLLPAVGALLLSRPVRDDEPDAATESPARVLSWPVLCCVPMLIVSAVLTVTTFARDDAVWRSANRLTEHGVAATAINAGSSWDGWHATTPLVRDDKPDVNQYVGDLWAQRFPQSSDCYVVSLSVMPKPDWRLLRVARTSPYGTGLGSAPVYTYQRVAGHPFGDGRCHPPLR